MFSGGLDHPSYVDHSYLAVQLGVHLVEGADLVVRQRRVWLRTLDGLESVDVLYRRLEDPTVDPLEVAAHGSLGVPGILQAVRAGGVALANAHGSGVVEEPELASYVDAAIERVRPGATSLPRLVDDSTMLTRVPMTPDAGGPLGDAPLVLRLFAVDDGMNVAVLPGGTGRVLAPGDDPRRPTACVAKDVWVLGRTVAPVIGTRLPQVDFGRSLPTRAADALYWTNRSAERAEAMARTGSAWSRLGWSRIPAWHCSMAADGSGGSGRCSGTVRRAALDEVPSADLHDELRRLNDAVAWQIGSLLTEATTVREYLSVTTGRVLAHLAELRTAMTTHRAGVDDLDAVLADFAAFAGLWHESIVRGPAWRIGDTGRRLERALVVIDLVAAALDGERGESSGSADVEAAVVEVLLAANESLVAYRRRHRSDVELEAAISLLIHDDTNPRSLVSAIDRLERHALDSDWPVERSLADRARAALSLPLAELLPTARAVVVEAGVRVIERWFSAPVSPVVLRPTEVETS